MFAVVTSCGTCNSLWVSGRNAIKTYGKAPCQVEPFLTTCLLRNVHTRSNITADI